MRKMYAVRWVARAARDAAARVGLVGGLVIAVAALVLAWWYGVNYKPDLVGDLLLAGGFGVLAVLLAFGVVLVPYLLLAPARIEKDERMARAGDKDADEKRITDLEKDLAEAVKLAKAEERIQLGPDYILEGHHSTRIKEKFMSAATTARSTTAASAQAALDSFIDATDPQTGVPAEFLQMPFEGAAGEARSLTYSPRQESHASEPSVATLPESDPRPPSQPVHSESTETAK